MKDHVMLLDLRAMHKPPRGPNSALSTHKKFEVNLLANSLTSKLKLQRRSALFQSNPGAYERAVLAESTANGDSVGQKVAKSILARQDRRRHSRQAARTPRSEAANTATSSHREESVASVRKESQSGKVRIDSSGSERLPRLSPDRKKSPHPNLSRRSNSASPVASTARDTARRSNRHVTPSERSQSDLAFMYSSDASVVSEMSFECRGPGRSVMVVKRDGVFQPLDKYAPPRPVIREATPARQSGACDYEVYQICDGSDYDDTPRAQDDSRRGLKVSWSKTMMEAEFDHELENLPGDDRTAQSTPANALRRAVSVDNFAFRRPTYSSGRSRVASIGVKWCVPIVAKDGDKKETDTKTAEVPNKVKEAPSRKPMWSWLVTNEAPQSSQSHKTRGGTSAKPTDNTGSVKESSKTGSTGGSSVLRHRRDVHPVSTAMEREGTSVSKTKWHVPSSTSSTLENERAIFGRLELVKRPGNQLLYDGPPTIGVYGTDYTLSRPTQDRTTVNAERAKMSASKEGEEQNDKSKDEDSSNYSSTEDREEVTPSPTKSRIS